jgi:hypothetical protein
LPCRGCKYCQKAHEAWTKFILDVDEAVPLAKKKIIYGQQIDVSIAMIRLLLPSDITIFKLVLSS